MPKVFLINLDKSPDRLAISKERLAKYNVALERVPGVLGSALTQAQIDDHYSPQINQRDYHRPLSAGEIGCYLSHRKAWQEIARGDDPYGVVLEDDVKVVGDLNIAFETLDALEFSWDLVKLSAYEGRERKIVFSQPVLNDMHVVIHKKPMSGGAATAITRSAAKRLLVATEKFGRPVDSDIQYFWEKDIEVVSLMPYPFEQDLDFTSTMETKKIRHRGSFWRRKRQQLVSMLKNRKEVRKQVTKLKNAGS